MFLGFTASLFLDDIREAPQSGESEENISRLAQYGEKVFNEISAWAEARGVPFYPHDMQRLDGGIGLNNLISLMNGRKTPELEEMLRKPTEEERRFGMAPSITVAECEYNAIGYFLAALLKKLYVRLGELRVRRESEKKDI